MLNTVRPKIPLSNILNAMGSDCIEYIQGAKNIMSTRPRQVILSVRQVQVCAYLFFGQVNA